MPPEILRWLRELDQQGGFAPKGYDYAAASDEIKRRQPEIEGLLGTKLKLQFEQDCACLAALMIASEIFRDPVSGSNTQRLLLCVSFCTFGRIVVIRGDELQKYSDKLHALYDYLEAADYKVLDPSILIEPYTGAYAGQPGTDCLTWYSRFFEYL
jgi:hypothetical protein